MGRLSTAVHCNFQVRASDNEDEIYEREHEAHPSAAPSVEGSAVASRLSALKARLEADRSRAAVPKAFRYTIVHAYVLCLHMGCASYLMVLLPEEGPSNESLQNV